MKTSKQRIGVLLAGGDGKRMSPSTLSISKQLIPIFDKPMIFYSLSLFLNIGLKKIVIICKHDQYRNFFKLLGDGSSLGIKIEYVFQNKPKGIAHGLLISKDNIENNDFFLLLGDNIFISYNLESTLYRKLKETTSSSIFIVNHNKPNNFGVLSTDSYGAQEIIEKPTNYVSSKVVSGIYFYKNDALKVVDKLKPSKRGELEITDLNNKLLEVGNLQIDYLDEEIKWFDNGTFENILDCSNCVESLEREHNFVFGCPYFNAYKNKLISFQELNSYASSNKSSSYFKKLRMLIGTDEDS